jgi:transposase
VYGWDTLVLLKHYLDSGLSKAAIARQLGLSRGVIYHWLRTGQLERDLSQPQIRRATPRPTKLDAYHPLIQERLTTYPELSAVRLFAECRAAGYAGGYSQLTAYVARVRPRPAPEPVVRFETAPGEQAQFDFAEVRFPWGKRFVLLVVPRLLPAPLRRVRRAPDGAHRHARARARLPELRRGAAARPLRSDESVIVEDHRPGGGRLLENPEFLRFAAHWGFRIRACRPYRARTKGKVERPVSYVRRNFLYGRTFLGDADLADQCACWLSEIANQRVHGTTKVVPAIRFTEEEQAVRQPLAARPYHSLVLGPAAPPSARVAQAPPVPVERRALTAYAELVAPGAYAEVS